MHGETKVKLRKEKIVESIKNLWKVRPKISHETILVFSALFLIFLIALVVRLLPMRWGMALSEFDPYLQYHFTEHVVNKGFLSWVDWRDYQRWYPWGAYVPKTNLPGLPLTAATFYTIISTLGIQISLKDFCILFSAIMGAITCIALYFLGKDMGGKDVGLLSALILALSPTYITRTSIGFFDDETVGLLGVILCFLFFLKAIEEDKPIKSSIIYGILSGIALGYVFSAWGAALYPAGIITLFSFVIILLRRYSTRFLLSYSLLFGIGLFIAINVPKLGIGFLKSWAILVVAGIFLLLCLNEVVKRTRTTKWKIVYVAAFISILVVGFLTMFQLGYVSGIAGKFISVLNPFARESSPIVMSVQEHHVTSWSSLYYEFGVVAVFMVLGFFFIAGNLTNRNIFLIIFGLTALYFSSSMVRVLVLSAPAVGLIAGIGITRLIKPFMAFVKEHKFIPKKKAFTGVVGREFSAVPIIMCFLLLMANFAFPYPRVFTHAYSPVTILSASMPIRSSKPVTEWVDALQWMKTNLPKDAIVFSWWDYGYWITVEANRTSLADNNTFNTTQIALIGRAFVENETNALKIISTMRNPPKFPSPPTHILVFLTVWDRQDVNFTYVGFGDMGKWTWMLRIAESSSKVQSKFGKIVLSDYINETTNQPIDGGKFYDSLIYKLMEHARYVVVKAKHPDANIVDVTAYSNEFNKHFKLIYPTSTRLPKAYSGIVPIIAIYEINYSN